MSVAASERVLGGLRWVELGRSERGAWGRCRGSAAQPYAVVVPSGEAGRATCSCPSRRRPCKHAVALTRAYAAGLLPEGDEPAYARDWVDQQAARTPRVSEPTRTPDPEAAAKRRAARRERVESGLAELERWLADQVRTGLAAMPRAGYRHVDEAAARLVDAQAPGVASMIRSLPGDFVGEGWPERLLHALGAIHLLARSHARLDDLPADLAATIRSRVGYPTTKEAVLATPGVADTWWPVGAVETEDDQLASLRVWMRGARTGRWALWLTYAPAGQSLDRSVEPGVPLVAELHFYPGAGQFRATVGTPTDVPAAPLHAPGETWAGVDRRFAALVADDPWASRMPVIVAGVPVPPAGGGPWRLRDATGELVELQLDGEGWPLLAQSGGEPLSVFGEWTGRVLVALAVLPDDHGRSWNWSVAG